MTTTITECNLQVDQEVEFYDAENDRMQIARIIDMLDHVAMILPYNSGHEKLIHLELLTAVPANWRELKEV